MASLKVDSLNFDNDCDLLWSAGTSGASTKEADISKYRFLYFCDAYYESGTPVYESRVVPAGLFRNDLYKTEVWRFSNRCAITYDGRTHIFNISQPVNMNGNYVVCFGVR